MACFQPCSTIVAFCRLFHVFDEIHYIIKLSSPPIAPTAYSKSSDCFFPLNLLSSNCVKDIERLCFLLKCLGLAASDVFR